MWRTTNFNDNIAKNSVRVGSGRFTARYAAPEVLAMDPDSGMEADVYAFCCVIFELVRAGDEGEVAECQDRGET